MTLVILLALTISYHQKIKPQRYLVIVVMLLENLAFVKLCSRDMQYLQCSPYSSWVSDAHW